MQWLHKVFRPNLGSFSQTLSYWMWHFCELTYLGPSPDVLMLFAEKCPEATPLCWLCAPSWLIAQCWKLKHCPPPRWRALGASLYLVLGPSCLIKQQNALTRALWVLWMLFGKLQAGCHMPFNHSGLHLYTVQQRPGVMKGCCIFAGCPSSAEDLWQHVLFTKSGFYLTCVSLSCSRPPAFPHPTTVHVCI